MVGQTPNDPQDTTPDADLRASRDYEPSIKDVKAKQEKTRKSGEEPSPVPDLEVDDDSLVRPENS
ncbi:hypothetical protein [Paeniglutamicibacter antarcticus]|uniref:Uncharacterized protein n=1 Tax=Paeniglutamicibacter antarcticus TaxID=494023 RepID=A0ABP9TSZ6_9MICC